MVGAVGFEPTTPTPPVLCRENYSTISRDNIWQPIVNVCNVFRSKPGETRASGVSHERAGDGYVVPGVRGCRGS